MNLSIPQRQIIKRCQTSVQFFIDQFCMCRHPKLGEIKFKLFDYQQSALFRFRTSRYVIFWKTRQCGMSTVVGAYALWYAMFGNSKTVLIVSKRDDDAKEFLEKNVKFVYDRLPDWMRNLWPRIIDNEHKLGFPNGSRITSLSSSPDTLRSNSASLVILDECGHMPHMDEMWSAGAPTLQHAGQCLCLGTPNGVGNWYWQTVTDAEERLNDFDLVKINWWDMKWRLEHVDPVTNQETIIAPTNGIRETTPDEKKKYGKQWSPWLETQYRLLTERGDDKKFRQEVLAQFLGSGNTVVSTESLEVVRDQHISEHLEVTDVEYVSPATDERMSLSFDRKFWIWDRPVRGIKRTRTKPEREINLVKQPRVPDEEPHIYMGGVDTPEGDGSDYASIEILDVTTREQVAELKMKVQPRILARMADYIGRYYNNALLVVESTGIGRATAQELEALSYPNLWRPRKVGGKFGAPGYKVTPSSKPMINKALMEHLGTEGGFKVKSFRLYKELCIYVHLSSGKTGNERGAGNNDDLVIGAGLALACVTDAVSYSSMALMPYMSQVEDPMADIAQTDIEAVKDQKKIVDIAARGGTHAVMPFMPMMDSLMPSIGNELEKFTRQIGGIPVIDGKPLPVTSRRHTLPGRSR